MQRRRVGSEKVARAPGVETMRGAPTADAFVESYRQISRAPEIRSRPIDVAAWGRELEALFRASERAVGIDFALAVDETLTLEADPDLMSQVLINLIRNAGQAAREHRTGRARESNEAPHVWLSFARTRSGRAQIEVADNGPGVPDALRQDVFLPFFTTKAKGTGVGLSLARQVVLAHRGSISVGDRQGRRPLFPDRDLTAAEGECLPANADPLLRTGIRCRCDGLSWDVLGGEPRRHPPPNARGCRHCHALPKVPRVPGPITEAGRSPAVRADRAAVFVDLDAMPRASAGSARRQQSGQQDSPARTMSH